MVLETCFIYVIECCVGSSESLKGQKPYKHKSGTTGTKDAVLDKSVEIGLKGDMNFLAKLNYFIFEEDHEVITNES